MPLLNLFSIFDPTSYFVSFGWLIVGFLVIFPGYCVNEKRKRKITLILIFKSLLGELSSNILRATKLNTFYVFILFCMLLFLNTNALSPYTFTITAHIVINFSFALVVWFSIVSYQVKFNILSRLIHLVPVGTPYLLLPVMVVIELTRIFIRPITLSVRLTANIIAGHLLMSLLGEARAHTIGLAVGGYLAFMLLLFLECAVAIIQAYVFITLISLYVNEAL